MKSVELFIFIAGFSFNEIQPGGRGGGEPCRRSRRGERHPRTFPGTRLANTQAGGGLQKKPGGLALPHAGAVHRRRLKALPWRRRRCGSRGCGRSSVWGQPRGGWGVGAARPPCPRPRPPSPKSEPECGVPGEGLTRVSLRLGSVRLAAGAVYVSAVRTVERGTSRP